MTGYPTNARARAGYASAYVDTSLSTASPQRLLVLLYDRLVLDLTRGEDALREGQHAGAHLMHAQDIVMELLTSLDVSAWEGGRGLASLYTFVHQQLVTANIRRDPDLVVTCRGLVEPLRDAWRQAAAGSPVAAPAVGTVQRPRVPMTPVSA